MASYGCLASLKVYIHLPLPINAFFLAGGWVRGAPWYVLSFCGGGSCTSMLQYSHFLPGLTKLLATFFDPTLSSRIQRHRESNRRVTKSTHLRRVRLTKHSHISWDRVCLQGTALAQRPLANSWSHVPGSSLAFETPNHEVQSCCDWAPSYVLRHTLKCEEPSESSRPKTSLCCWMK